MALLSEQDRQTVRGHLAVIEEPVRLLFFTQTFGAPDTVAIAKQVLDEIVCLNDHLTLEEVNFVLEQDRARQYGVEQIPTIVLLKGDQDTRIRFLGAPAGYEFMSLIEAVILAGTNDSGLTPDSRALVAEHVTEPLNIQVFVTPTCPYCPKVASLAHQAAVENGHVTADVVEIGEFPDLAAQYHVRGVPKIVMNDTVELVGAQPEAAFVDSILRAAA